MKIYHLSYLFLFGLILSVSTASGQKSLQFLNSKYDIGKIDNWANHPAEFLLVNTGNKPEAILKAEYDPDLKIYFNRNYIHPGDTAIVQAYYVPKEPGPFSRGFRIYLSDRKSPVNLKFNGYIYSMDECPDFYMPGDRKPPGRTIIVEDKISGEGLNNVHVEMILNDRVSISGKTNRKGELLKNLKPGLYQVSIKRDDYNTYSEIFYLNFRTREIEFKLTPVQIPYVDKHDLHLDDEEPIGGVFIPAPEQKDIPEPVNIQEDVIEKRRDFINGELSITKYSENNIVLLLDVSSSMRSGGKMDLLKLSIANMIVHLREIDKISVITYASKQNVIFEGIPANRKDTIFSAIAGLKAVGSTHGIAGINRAYELAKQNFLPDGNNQLIVATDGEFNSPSYSDKKLESMIKAQKNSGIKLSILAYGEAGPSTDRMKNAAAAGGGNFLLVDKDCINEDVLLQEIMQQSKR